VSTSACPRHQECGHRLADEVVVVGKQYAHESPPIELASARLRENPLPERDMRPLDARPWLPPHHASFQCAIMQSVASPRLRGQRYWHTRAGASASPTYPKV
jgi:hypothetical protein